MTSSIVLRNRNTLPHRDSSRIAKKVKSLLNFVEYKQTHFSIDNDDGIHLIPANKIKTVEQLRQGTIINCLNNKSVYSSQPIDYWKKSLSIFDRFVEEEIAYNSKIIPLN